MTIQKRIIESRNKAGITQVEMAKRLCIARQTYIDLEKGVTEPRITNLMGVATITGATLEWLVYGREDNKDKKIREIQGRLIELQQMVNAL